MQERTATMTEYEHTVVLEAVRTKSIDTCIIQGDSGNPSVQAIRRTCNILLPNDYPLPRLLSTCMSNFTELI